MYSICRSVAFVALASLPLIACGGDDDGGGGGVTVPDAKVFMDAPPMQSTCLIPASIPGGALGSDTMRQSADWIGVSMGKTRFAVSIPIDQEMKHWFNLVVFKNGADWTRNTAIPFTTDPTAQTAQAVAYLEENYNDTTMKADRLLWASSGSITFTDIDQTANAKITFSTSAANFREIDQTTGADVAGGCTSMAAAVQVFLTQKTAVTDPQTATVTLPAGAARLTHHVAADSFLAGQQ